MIGHAVRRLALEMEPQWVKGSTRQRHSRGGRTSDNLPEALGATVHQKSSDLASHVVCIGSEDCLPSLYMSTCTSAAKGAFIELKAGFDRKYS